MSAPAKTQVKIDEEPPLIIIERKFPRIARSIETLWGHRELDDYLTNLILADRTGREGFPPETLNALLKLHNQHGARFSFPSEEKSWERGPRVTRAANR
jgi:hypothetical protein